jgi:hypothetical protein
MRWTISFSIYANEAIAVSTKVMTTMERKILEIKNRDSIIRRAHPYVFTVSYTQAVREICYHKILLLISQSFSLSCDKHSSQTSPYCFARVPYNFANGCDSKQVFMMQ